MKQIANQPPQSCCLNRRYTLKKKWWHLTYCEWLMTSRNQKTMMFQN